MSDPIVIEESAAAEATGPMVIEDAGGDDDARVIDNPDGTRTLLLRHPIEVIYRGPKGERTETLDRLTFRRPTGADMRALGRFGTDQVAAGIYLFCRLSGLADKVYDRLDGEDVVAGADIVTGFTGRSRRTGPT